MKIHVGFLEKIMPELPPALQNELRSLMQKARDTHAAEEKKRRETHVKKSETHIPENAEISQILPFSAENCETHATLGGERGGSFLNNSSVRTNGTLSTLTQGTLFNKEKEKINKKEKKSCGSHKSDKTELEKDFEIFWAAWPRHFRKTDTKGSFKAFRNAFNENKGLTIATILKGLEWWKNSLQWLEGEDPFTRKLIPGPKPWLNQRKWEVLENIPQCEPASAPIASYALPSREPKHGFVDPKEFSEGLKKAIAEANT